MESQIGTSKMPSWSNSLLWKSTGAFRIRWLAISDVTFQKVAHLRNSLNENQPVLIGRDGQEISVVAGSELCKILLEKQNRDSAFTSR